MRQWRVGSISMGITLIGLGVILFISQFTNWEINKIALLWVPVLLIVLGVEILVYLYLAKSEQPVIKYDVFSILFITFISCVSIGFYVGASSGVLAAIDGYINEEERTGALPLMEETVGENVEKIVIDSSNHFSKITANNTKQVSIFGTYQTNTDQQVTEAEVASFHQIGETLYVSLFLPPARNGWNYQYTNFYPTISLPADIDVEVIGHTSQLNVNLADIKANWYVEAADAAHLKNKQASDINLSIEHVNTPGNKEVQTFGNGTYSLQVGNVHTVKEYE
ncbi:hypothetical protein SAMN04487944_101562 [Gracilibacillus ureilyticus]|uniref:Uncharacterized protein n=1 Tax=Gracilibacillus ureilyticus TaxID=531814 RepID=A0A1H9M5S3_9BACI|nr:hypothetical protein [Gracilibacillus ureilyticus]SER18827.1 hypothetical protein SAMN04487944_101562 [Gracilibacillus ureilyticus]